MYSTKRTTSITTVVLSGLLVLGTSASPAAARQDPGQVSTKTEQLTPRAEGASCPLRRVGTQFVRCDNLTGNGVPAPAWVSVR
jgi:hypothetical protein